jgi:hypothetical protein
VTDEEYQSRQKLLAVIEQIDQPDITGCRTILCPYCDSFNVDGQNLCCDMLRKAVVVILMGRRNDAIARHIGNSPSN